MGSIVAVSSEAARAEPKVQERKQLESRAAEESQSSATQQTRNDDAVVVNIESRVTDEAAADSLAQSLSSKITAEGTKSLDAQPEPEPRIVQDLLA
jgi:mannitol-1-phosphate/altronate dehydrogenase